MTRLLIPLDDTAPKNPGSTDLAGLICGALVPSLGAIAAVRALEGGKIALAIRQGCAWLGNRRIKNPALSLAGLRNQGKDMGKDAFRGAVRTDILQVQVFWPEKSIAEYSLAPSQVIFEDEDLLVVYKPAGLNTCQSVFSDINCLTWGVQKLLDERAAIQSDPLDTEAALPGRYVVRTINRLDYATRGLVFYAKHKAAEKALHRMFMERQMHKRYLAATKSFAPAPDWLRIRDTLQWQDKVQAASTLVKKLGEHAGLLWWAVLPQTGRTHQIRKHFAAYLQAIEGDTVYRTAGSSDPVDDPSPDDDNGEVVEPATSDPDSLMLSCVAYRFRHPISGQRMVVSYLPPDLGLPV